MAIPIETRLKLNSSDVDKGVTRAKRKFGEMKQSALGVGSAVRGVFAAVGAVQMIRTTARWADELDRIGKLATRLDTSAERLQRIGYAADKGGTDLETATNALTRLARKATDLENAGLVKAFRELGIEQKKFTQLSVEDQLKALADAFVTAEDRGTAFRHLFTLLEDDAKQLIPLLEQGGTGLEETFSKATVATAAQVRAAEELKDAMADLDNQTVGYKARAVQGFNQLLKEWRAIIGAARGDKDAYLKAFYPDVHQREMKATQPRSAEEINAEIDRKIGEIFNAGAERNRAGVMLSSARVKLYDKRADVGIGSAATFFDFVERQANIARAKKLSGYQSSFDSVLAGLNMTEEKRAAINPFSVVASSMAAIGGGGGVATAANPQVRKLERLIKIQEDALKAIRESAKREGLTLQP